MSTYLQSIALRGVGVQALPERTIALPRPVSRFESHRSDGPDTFAEGGIEAESQPAATVTRPAPALPATPPRGSPRAREREHVPGAGDPTPRAEPTRVDAARLAHQAASEDSEDTSRAVDATPTSPIGETKPPITRIQVETQTGLPDASERRPSNLDREMVPTQFLQPPAPTVALSLPATPASPRAMERERVIPLADGDSAPKISVSIGRIDVVVDQPPAPAAPSGPERSRGFSGYARARRGHVR